MLAYLAGPIDAAGNDAELYRLRESARAELERAGFAVYDPSRLPFINAKADAKACYDINEYAMERSEAVLALLPPGRTTNGTPMEIQTAAKAGKAVAAVVGSGWSMQLAGLGVKTFNGPNAVGEAVEHLKDESGLGLDPMSRSIRKAMSRLHTSSGLKYMNQHYSSPSLVELRWTGDPDCAPVAGYQGDAGWDLIVSRDTKVPVDGFADVPCGIRIELPEGYWARITGRSSTIRKRHLHIAEGIIDNGYRGELFCAAWNLGDEPVRIGRGERIAQLIPFKLERPEMKLVEVDELGESDRGEAGFGSTGV